MASAAASRASSPSAPQARSVQAFRRFLSSERTEFDLQSYPFFGSLVDRKGRTSTFSLMMQQTEHAAMKRRPVKKLEAPRKKTPEQIMKAYGTGKKRFEENQMILDLFKA